MAQSQLGLGLGLGLCSSLLWGHTLLDVVPGLGLNWPPAVAPARIPVQVGGFQLWPPLAGSPETAPVPCVLRSSL